MSQLLAGNWQLFEAVNEHAGHNHLLDALMVFCANDLIYLFVPLLALWGLMFVGWSPLRSWAAKLTEGDRALGLRTVVMGVIAAGFAVVCNLAIEHVVFEPRPFISHPAQDHLLIAHTADASFPSDHTGIAFAVAGALVLCWLLIARRQGRRAQPTTGVWSRVGMLGLMALLALLMAVVIGVARIFAGVHYPLDIVGGVGTGMLSAAAATRLGQALQRPFASLFAKIPALRVA